MKSIILVIAMIATIGLFALIVIRHKQTMPMVYGLLATALVIALLALAAHWGLDGMVPHVKFTPP
ncbi:hypothetical protein [uncultured Tateyamaria sp.]|uniref:hypothetical protein n=1 Tax=uncultured Tateyamaria sp. TaxID=455651 RepID=UPI0026196182|nr:hypothetical protein [uncultured Tateyamaria sp.]